jgi:histidinol-phosphate/aromatic aminotransferase/cobyric acid decarboxylase-like protein/choline kinase
MQAIILAAGMGKRLNYLTRDNTKCMVEINGVTLIERMLKQLDTRHLSNIILAVGYKKESLMDFVKKLNLNTKLTFISNDDYEYTNNIYSLFLTRDYLKDDDTVILDSDIIFEDDVLDFALDCDQKNCALIDSYKSWMTGIGVQLDSHNCINRFIDENHIDYTNKEKCYKTIGIYKFCKDFLIKYFIPYLDTYIACFGKSEKYEQVLKTIPSTIETEVYAKHIGGKNWYEINDLQDIDLASTLFSNNDEEAMQAMLGRWGGYWRYPGYLDYFYLVTPYYPTTAMINEMKASFEDLLTQYPSGMKVNALLAAKEFGVHPENIVIGNGASELIKSIMEKISGAVGVIRPTFEEYANRYNKEQEVDFYVNNCDFHYTAEQIIEYFTENKVDNLVIINPDNPSGNYIKKADMIRIVQWADEQDIKLIVDESFIDFADEDNPSLISQEILDSYSGLYVIKSIAKSYGVPGLRLGVLASGDKDTIAWMKKDVSIWNINSFAEFYMQIANKYRTDYSIALQKFRIERRYFENALNSVDELRVIPSQANYVMVELYGIDAIELKKRMLIKKHIFIKTLEKKLPGNEQYLRLAIRNHEDNVVFISALKDAILEIKGNKNV